MRRGTGGRALDSVKMGLESDLELDVEVLLGLSSWRGGFGEVIESENLQLEENPRFGWRNFRVH